MDAVTKYRLRRAERLGIEKETDSVTEYRRRRAQRLSARFDDDEDEGGNHGNTKIPFGLCQREGIKVQPGWTPTDAWNALEGKGYSAKETYQRLKKTGTAVKGKGGAAKISRETVPKAFKTPMGKKMLDVFESEFSKCQIDGNAKQLLTDFGRVATSGKGFIEGLEIKEAENINDYYMRAVPDLSNGGVKSQELSIPDLSKIPEDLRPAVAGAIAHEMVHYLSLCNRPDANDAYMNPVHTYANEELRSELGRVLRDLYGVGKPTGGETGFSPEVKDVLKKNFDRFQELKDTYEEETQAEHDRIVNEYRKKAEEMGVGSGEFAYCYLPEEIREEMYNKVDSYETRREKDFGNNYFKIDGGAAAAFSNMYDAIARGGEITKGLCFCGHGWQYFETPWRVSDEVLSIYVQLQMATDKSYLNLFRKDQPKLAELLDDEIDQLLGKKR